MSSKRKPNWFIEFTPQQNALVTAIVRSRTRMAFIIGLAFGALLTASIAYLLSYIMSEAYVKMSQADIVHNAVENKLSSIEIEMEKWRKSIQAKPEDFKNE